MSTTNQEGSCVPRNEGAPDIAEATRRGAAMGTPLRLVAMALVGALLTGCATPREPSSIEVAIAHVRANLPTLDIEQASVIDAHTRTYFDYYGLAPDNAAHAFGTFASGTHQLAAHIFTPSGSRGTVLLVHGYYDHAGIWRNLLARLLDEGFTVAILELPGHGLSSGERATVSDFAEYKTAVGDFIIRCGRDLGAPLHVVAHSMGAGVTADYLLSDGSANISGEIVFLAPLIRPAHEWISVPARVIASPFRSSVKRRIRRNSSDEAFLAFVKSDPLHERHLPFSFCSAMRAWYKRMPERVSSERELLIIQGTDDSTISWRANLRFMRAKFPNAEHVRVPKAGHQLANESLQIRENVFRRAIGHLGKTHGGN